MLLLLSALIVTAQTGAPEKGPRLGETIPSFQARDQFGRTQTLRTLTGPRGLVLLFVRSADW
jgi:peroxiredoxin